MKLRTIVTFVAVFGAIPTVTNASNNDNNTVSDSFVAAQRDELRKNTEGKGFGPQAPRDIGNLAGKNDRIFSKAPHFSNMKLCNIHFHKFAEHKGGDFTRYAGNGDGKGHNTGYLYSGKLTGAELKPYNYSFSGESYNKLKPGDTIELHYVYTTTQIEPGPTLDACMSNSIGNPQLRVEAQVLVLVNDRNAHDFVELTKHGLINGYVQALNIPNFTGRPIEYAGSTTGASYNDKGSPFQVTWSVRPKVLKTDIASVVNWLKNNKFEETGPHTVRNLVTDPNLLSNGH